MRCRLDRDPPAGPSRRTEGWSSELRVLLRYCRWKALLHNSLQDLPGLCAEQGPRLDMLQQPLDIENNEDTDGE
jgi:hypothetical protein